MIRRPPRSTRTDTLFPYTTLFRSISDRLGASSEAIARANNIPPPFIIRIGERLSIPGGRYHRVKSGETGIAIARAYGVSRSEEHTSELQSLMRISYAVFCLKKKTIPNNH